VKCIYFTDTIGTASGQGTVTYRAEEFQTVRKYYCYIWCNHLPDRYSAISSIVKDFSNQNYPNPFNPVTNIEFAVDKNDFVLLKIYDILGREVKSLVSQNLTAGEYKVDFDAKGLSSGMYYYSLRAGENISVKKMVLVK
jgi:hypothetical protein